MNVTTALVPGNGKLVAALSGNGFSLDVFNKEIKVLECIVSGTSHAKIDTIKNSLVADSSLTVKRECKNEYDDFAVSLHFEGFKIGFVPREKNETIARLMDAGKQFTAHILNVSLEGKWLKIKIAVSIKI